MTENDTTEMYYANGSVGDRHWISGQAYPPEKAEHYAKPRVLDAHVDARAVYGGGDVNGEGWGVIVADVPEGESDDFTVAFVPSSPREEQYAHLIREVEARLGRTGLTMLVY